MNTTDTTQKRTALITGASGGIGLELAKLFARDAYNLVLVARNADKLAQVKTELEKRRGVTVRTIARDLSDPTSPHDIFTELDTTGVQIDALVNNAGYALFGPFAEAAEQEVLDMLQVNIMALTHLTRLFLPSMLARGQGRILNLGSTAAFLPGPLMAIYYASKAYVLSFSEAIAEEVKGTGVTVTVLCPGSTETGFQKRANMENSRLVANRRLPDAASVARAGYKAMIQGKTLEVPGLGNNMVPLMARLAPRRLVPAIVKRSQERREH
jgi:short-subunit dehydrogenase